jgi:hypothetical protein
LRRVTDLFFGAVTAGAEDVVDFSDEMMSKLLARIKKLASTLFGDGMAEHAIERDNSIPLQPIESTARTDTQGHVGERAVSLSDDRADERLAFSILSRPDISRQQMVGLVHDASEALRLQLEAESPRQAGAIRPAIASSSERIYARARFGSVEFHLARAALPAMHAQGRPTETALNTLVEQGSFDHVVTALSLIGDLPVALVERTMAQERFELIMLQAKAAMFSTDTALALIAFQAAGKTNAAPDQEQHAPSYARIQVKTAKAALQFYRLREIAYRQ